MSGSSINIETYSTIVVIPANGYVTIRLNRPDAQNAINGTLLKELHYALKGIEEDDSIKVIVLEGGKNVFCTGMDFTALTDDVEGKLATNDSQDYYDVLNYFSKGSKVIISKVDGRVNAGGIGFVAASDIVIATDKSTFALSEALFGLLPACVLPFLVRRIGYQKALMMTLTTSTVSTSRAYEIGLVDIQTDNIDNELRKLLLRLTKLETQTINGAKDYLSNLWILDERTENLAVDTITRLASSDKVQKNVKNYISTGRFPWDNK
ncbi:MAG: enoyl-CoA hydratase/isomerase [Crocinitomicaceae bacterium]|nr:enoyl-CoA hydratase/isomerase [Crocinitomicaceae bacterium]